MATGLLGLIVCLLWVPSLQKIVPYSSKFRVGMGLNSATMTPKSPKCVKGLRPGILRKDAVILSEDWYSTGLKTSLEFKGVSNSVQLHKELHLAFGAGYAAMGKGAEVAIAFAKSTILSKYEAAYVIRMTVDNSQVERFDPRAGVVWDESLNDHPGLADLCGDYFVESIQSGGMLVAFFKVSKLAFVHSKVFHKTVESTGWGYKIESILNRTFTQRRTVINSKINVLSMGGNGYDWEFGSVWNISGLKAKVHNFPRAVQDAPWKFKMKIKPWASVFPGYMPQAVVNFSAQKKQLDLLEHNVLEMQSMQRSAQFVVNNKHMFGLFDDYDCVRDIIFNTQVMLKRAEWEFQTLRDSVDARLSPLFLVPSDDCLPGDHMPDEYMGCFADSQIPSEEVKATDIGEDDKQYFPCKNFAIAQRMEYFGLGGELPSLKSRHKVCFLVKPELATRLESGEVRPMYGYGDCGNPCVDLGEKSCGRNSWNKKMRAIYRMVPPRKSVSDAISLSEEDEADEDDYLEFVTRTSTSLAPSSLRSSGVFGFNDLFDLKLTGKVGLFLTSMALFGAAMVALRGTLHRPPEARLELELTSRVC